MTRRSLQTSLKRHQNNSYLSVNNVLCQDRKLRGRILSPSVVVRKKRIQTKRKFAAPYNDANSCGPTIVVTPKVLLYKTIKRLWHENLHVFIYHSNSIDFSNFIHSFPELIAVQIKVVHPSNLAPGVSTLISAKNFIFLKKAFLKMLDSTDLDSYTQNIMIILHSSNNEESRTMRLAPKIPEICAHLNNDSQNKAVETAATIKSTKEVSQECKALDLRTITSRKPSTAILSRNILNKLRRLNTVIRRLPNNTSSYRNASDRNSGSSKFYSNAARIKRKSMLMNVPTGGYSNLQSNLAFNRKFVEVPESRRDRLGQLSNHLVSGGARFNSYKIKMWMAYTSSTELFDRNVSLAELDDMPIESIFNPGEDINLDEYL